MEGSCALGDDNGEGDPVHDAPHPLAGAILQASGGLAVASAVAPPFSGLDTFPALGANFVALAIILEDVLALAIGLGIGAGGVVLILTVGAALIHLVRGFFG